MIVGDLMVLSAGPPQLKVVSMKAFTTVASFLHKPWSGLRQIIRVIFMDRPRTILNSVYGLVA